jgi:hypothetical protein
VLKNAFASASRIYGGFILVTSWFVGYLIKLADEREFSLLHYNMIAYAI